MRNSTTRNLAIAALLFFLWGNSFATAGTLKGTVKNGTTGKPAAGNEVILLALSQAGMDEIARTRTDAAGRFSFATSDTQTVQLLRVMHQQVSYHKLVSARLPSVDVEVYDVAAKLDGVTVTAGVQRFQTDGDTLQVIEQIAVRNASKPPRTLMNDSPFEIQLPAEAQIDSAMVQSGRGQPLNAMPHPGTQRGRYIFSSPLRPGDTRFQLVYRLPYRATALIEPQFLYPLERLVVVLPSSMKFDPQTPGIFRPGSSKTEDVVQVASAVKPGQPLAFRISGTGVLSELRRTREQNTPGDEVNRPGGGLGAPSQLPDPLAEWRWYLLSAFAVVLTAGAVFVGRRPALSTPVAYIGNRSREELFRPEIRRRQRRVAARRS